MRPRVLLALGALAAAALLGCSDEEEPSAPTTTTAPDGIAECLTAQATVGVTDPPTDLVEVAADAGRIADLAFARDEPLASALAEVSEAAATLTDAARSGDEAAVAEAAGTLSAAYDGLDELAAELEAAECSSESWGRQVAIAAADLVGAGG